MLSTIWALVRVMVGTPDGFLVRIFPSRCYVKGFRGYYRLNRSKPRLLRALNGLPAP